MGLFKNCNPTFLKESDGDGLHSCRRECSQRGQDNMSSLSFGTLSVLSTEVFILCYCVLEVSRSCILYMSDRRVSPQIRCSE